MEEHAEAITQRRNKLKNFFFGWVEDNYDKAFIAVLIVAFAIRFIVFLKTMDQAIWWDAGDYLATAKRWAGINPYFIDLWYSRRGLFWPFFSSLFFRFGLGEIGLRLAVVLFSTGIIFVSYHLIKKMFNKKLALLVSIGLTFSWIFLFFSGRPLTNLPATFFLLTALLCFWKGYVLKEGNKFIYIFGAFFALACLTRMQYVTFTLPLLVLVFTKEKFKFLTNKHLWIAIGIFLLIFTPQFVMHYQHFGNPIADLATYYLGVGGSETGEVGVQLAKTSDLFVYFTNLPYILDGNNKGYSSLFALSPIYILFVIGFFYFFFDMFLGIDKIFKNPEIQKKFFILSWIVITFLLLGYIAPHLEQRYIMQTLPILFVIAIHPLILLEKFITKQFKISKTLAFILIITVLIICLYSNLAFGNLLIDSKKTSYLEVKLAGEWIKENSNISDTVVGGSWPQLTYYSERAVYPYHGKYRREFSMQNETALEEYIEKNRPKYLTASIFEVEEDWIFEFPQKHADMLVPVKVFYQGDKPVLIIYEFNYDNYSYSENKNF